MTKILIPVLDRAWTLEALHQASRIIRRRKGSITLLHMIPVSHPLWLGYKDSFLEISPSQRCDLREYKATAEDYNVVVEIQPMHYVSLKEALVQAADMLEVDIVFNKKATGILKYWDVLLHMRLAHRFSNRQQQLFTLEDLELHTYPNLDY
jgi:hypothetical protein